MIVSYSWLNSYLKIPVDLNSATDALTAIGLEVEGVNELFSAFDHLIVGKVLECKKHPNADKLKITKVDIGDKVKQIVCGANNVKKGQFVVVVLEGNELKTKKGEVFKIKKTKIRGEISEGMICAEDEIGLGDDHDGIIELSGEPEVGSLVSDFLNIRKDYSIEIGLTPNRTDAFSHMGVCRDLYAYFLNRQHNVKLSFPPVNNYANKSKLKMDLVVKNNNCCPKYLGVCIESIVVDDSPQWLKNRLISIGLKPINNVVDVTNFVLHETGNPLHAFDYKKISDKEVIVRQAKDGEEFRTLDSNLIKLNSDDLVISDSEKALCLAGVIGGENSGVTSSTTSVFLESAYFLPESIRKTSKRHGINSDSSYRFERGVDFKNCEYALRRAALLIQELCDASIGQEVCFSVEDLEERKIDFSFNFCNKILGHEIPKKSIIEILLNLGFKILSNNESGCQISIPTYRADVYREIDVVEEILRIYGYDNLPASNYVNFRPIIHDDIKISKYEIKNISSQLLTSNGFFEIKNNSLTKPSDLFPLESKLNVVKLINPLSEDLSIMRTNMFFSGLETLKYNLNRQANNLKLFEFGSVYFSNNNKYFEQEKLTIFSCGIFKGNNWLDESKNVNFYLMKGVLHKLLDRFFPKSFEFKITALNTSYSDFGLLYSFDFQSNDSLIINNIIEIGLFSKKVLNKLSIKKSIYYIDINLDSLMNLVNMQGVKYKSVPKFPSVKRDLSLLINKSTLYSDIEFSIKEVSGDLLKEVFLFDVYEGEKIKKNEKSYAISFVFVNEFDTLKDFEVDKEMLKIFNHLVSKHGVSLRDGELNS